jgi:hypothetical protein
MKKNKYLFRSLLLLFMFLPFAGCEPVTEDGDHADPITLYEKIGGKWTLSNLRQVDETALAAGISPNEINLFAQFQFGTLAIELTTENNLPTTYQVTGDAPELFPNVGYWKLNIEFPSADGTPPQILLYSDEAKTSQVGKLSIVSIPGARDEMELKLTRTTQGISFVSYLYTLKK